MTYAAPMITTMAPSYVAAPMMSTSSMIAYPGVAELASYAAPKAEEKKEEPKVAPAYAAPKKKKVAKKAKKGLCA